MDISTYAERLRHEVSAATALGGPDLAATAERLLLALDPAIRLVLLEALTDAAAEVSLTLPAGSVETRLRGRDLEFVVLGVAAPEHPEEAEETVEPTESDSADLARITLRLPENLKVKAEEAANDRGQSLNTWLVDAVRRAVRGGPVPPTPPLPPALDFVTRTSRTNRRMTGWA